jgi:uncharacterized protein YaaQ
MFSTRVLLVTFMMVFCSACATLTGAAGDDAGPMTVDVRVAGLEDDAQKVLEDELENLSGVSDLRRDPFGNEAVYTFEYDGDFETLRRKLQDISYPGLKADRVSAQLVYNGYDNRPPKLELISPNPDDLQTETNLTFVVGVEDTDVDKVTVNGTQASARQEGLYEATIPLKEGENEIELYAVDNAGNEARESVTVEVDTTPPEVEATIKVVVEGKVEPGSTVFVDGKEADVNMFGKWRIELEITQGQRTVEVVAIDKAGNKKVETKPIGK